MGYVSTGLSCAADHDYASYSVFILLLARRVHGFTMVCHGNTIGFFYLNEEMPGPWPLSLFTESKIKRLESGTRRSDPTFEPETRQQPTV